MILQILGVSIFLLALAFVLYYSKIYGVDRVVLFLTPLLLILLVLTSFPFIFREYIDLGFIRPLDMFLTFTSVSALLLCLAVYFKLRETENKLTKVVQELGLKDTER